MEDERVRLLPAEPAVRAHLGLERGHLARRRIEAAHDDQVAAIRHVIDAAETLRGTGPEGLQGIGAIDAVVGELSCAATAEDQGAAPLRTRHDEPDTRVADKSFNEIGVSRGDLLHRDPAG